MFNSIKMWISIVIIAIIASGGWFAWNYYQNSQAEMKRLIANNAKLELVLETNRLALEEKEKAEARQRLFLEELNNALNNSEKPLRELEKIFARHNLTNLALKKPGLIEERMNNATNEIFRAIECITANCLR